MRARSSCAHPLIECLSSLQRQNARSNQVGQLLTLVRIEQGVNLLECGENRGFQPLCAFNADLRAIPCPCGIELLARNRVGKCRVGAPIIDFGLRTFGLEFIEYLRQLTDLRFSKVEFVGEKTEGPSHSEVAATKVVAAAASKSPGWPTAEPATEPRWAAPGTTTTATLTAPGTATCGVTA